MHSGHFVEELDVSPVVALMEFNLAPLATRRDIAMMGLLFRMARGHAPPQFSRIIRQCLHEPFPRCLRQGERHNLQMHDPIDGTHSRMMGRSCLSLIYTFNMLPQSVLDLKTASAFQRCLQNAVKLAAEREIADWPCFLRAGVRAMNAPSLQSFFDAPRSAQGGSSC